MSIAVSQANGATLSADLSAVLAKPLILGASVSADYLTPSPGKRASLRYTSAANIDVLAANGRRGYDSVRMLQDSRLKDRTALIGVDTFFWDALSPSPTASVRAVESLVEKAESRGIPIIIGDVPVVMPSLQRSVVEVNRAIKRACEVYSRCRVLGLNALFAQVARDGYFDYKGRRYPIHELLPDGLHLGPPAAEYLSEEIERLLAEI